MRRDEIQRQKIENLCHLLKKNTVPFKKLMPISVTLLHEICSLCKLISPEILLNEKFTQFSARPSQIQCPCTCQHVDI